MHQNFHPEKYWRDAKPSKSAEASCMGSAIECFVFLPKIIMGWIMAGVAVPSRDFVGWAALCVPAIRVGRAKMGREAGVAGVHLDLEGGLPCGRGIPAPRSGRGATRAS